MRVAVTIVAGGLALVIALQLSTARFGGFLDGERLRTAGGIAWLIALLYLLGAAFAYGVPGFAVVTFVLVGMISLGMASDGRDSTFGVWGAVALCLAAMSAVGWREKRRLVRRQLVHRIIDEELVPIDSVDPPRAADPTT